MGLYLVGLLSEGYFRLRFGGLFFGGLVFFFLGGGGLIIGILRYLVSLRIKRIDSSTPCLTRFVVSDMLKFFSITEMLLKLDVLLRATFIASYSAGCPFMTPVLNNKHI